MRLRWGCSPWFRGDSRVERRMGVVAGESRLATDALEVGPLSVRFGAGSVGSADGLCCRRTAGDSGVGRLVRSF